MSAVGGEITRQRAADVTGTLDQHPNALDAAAAVGVGHGRTDSGGHTQRRPR